jgi:hypothetical protein
VKTITIVMMLVLVLVFVVAGATIYQGVKNSTNSTIAKDEQELNDTIDDGGWLPSTLNEEEKIWQEETRIKAS